MQGGSGFHRVSATFAMEMWIGLLAIISAIFRFFHSISGFVLASIEQGQTTTTNMRLEHLPPNPGHAPGLCVKASTPDLHFSNVNGGFDGPSFGTTKGCRGEPDEHPAPDMGNRREGEWPWTGSLRPAQDRVDDRAGPSAGPSRVVGPFEDDGVEFPFFPTDKQRAALCAISMSLRTKLPYNCDLGHQMKRKYYAVAPEGA